MSIKIEALKRIEEALANLGVQYRLELDDTVLTNVKPKKDMDRFKPYQVGERLKAASPGEVIKIDLIPETDVDIGQLQSNVCGRASQIYGKGKYITEANGSSVQVVVLP